MSAHAVLAQPHASGSYRAARRRVLGLAHLAAWSGGAHQALAAPAVPVRRLVFWDDFTDGALSRINEHAQGGRPGAPAWRSRARHPRHDVINGEKQVYLDPSVVGTGSVPLRLQPFAMEQGLLRVSAWPLPAHLHERLWGQRYGSGIITSELTHAQCYGWFEMRARLPRGRGLWPAFWLLPRRDAWPPEIDIFEASGDRPDQACFSVHEASPGASRHSGWLHLPAADADGFRTFGCAWTARRIGFYVQGRLMFEVVGHGLHEPMYVLANLAVGSHDPHWIPDPDASTPFPARLDIDWLRIYEL